MDASFVEGAWVAGDMTETWVRVGAGWRGVGLGPGGWFEVLEITPDAYVVRGVDDAPVAFALRRATSDAAVWANPDHDAPKRIAYARRGDGLVAKVSGGGLRARFPFVAVEAVRAPLPGAEAALASGLSVDGATGFVIGADAVIVFGAVDGGWTERARF